MISYLWAFLTAVANAGSNVLNRKATQEEPARFEFRPRLILDLLRRRTWLIAVAIMLVSFLLGATALGTGQLAAVQIIIILELPLTLIGGAKFLGSRLGRREWAAIAGLTGGVIGLLACLDPQSGQVPKITPAQWIIGSAATGGPVLVFFLLARRTQQPDLRAALLGVATGLGFGLASAYTKGMTEQFSSGGITAVLASWQLYAAAAAGITAGWLLQNAYHAGRLAASQPGITLADPAVSTAWGIVIFGEQVRGGLFLALALIPLAALIGSVFLLSRSPVLQDTAGESPGEAAEDTGGTPGAKDKAAKP
jgi:drug/metabolite transporter (DMT)-like permease